MKVIDYKTFNLISFIIKLNSIEDDERKETFHLTHHFFNTQHLSLIKII